MTQTSRTGRCAWCGRGFDVAAGPGRPRRFCTQTCRQQDYVSRLRAKDAGLTEAELVITRAELDDLRDKLYVLECAIGDAQRDLTAGDDPAAALDWILRAAAPLIGASLGER